MSNKTVRFLLIAMMSGARLGTALCDKVAALENARRSQRRAFSLSGVLVRTGYEFSRNHRRSMDRG